MLRGKVEEEMALFSDGSSVKERSEEVKGSAKISQRVNIIIWLKNQQNIFLILRKGTIKRKPFTI